MGQDWELGFRAEKLKDGVGWIPAVTVALQQNHIEIFMAFLMYLEETSLPTALPGQQARLQCGD